MGEPGSRTVEGVGVVLDHVSKRFGATQALDDVSLEIKAGEIHGLVGENGAGKSTLGKIIGGLYLADSGTLIVDGRAVGSRWAPASALASGIATIQQELSLVPGRSVAENVFLGIERSRFGLIKGSQAARYRALAGAAEFGISPDAIVGSLRLADQQKVEIMRALARDARLIVMDEPTSSLTKNEADVLHEVMDRLRREGRTIVYVSHFLDEILEWADTVTIMRDGTVTRTAPSSAETKETLIEGMLGRSFDATFPKLHAVPDDAATVLSLTSVSGSIPKRVSLSVRAGEILGIAGLVGSGRTELARLVFGADPIHEGQISLHGEVVSPLTPRVAIDHGIVMLPEDRRGLGLIMSQNLRENVTLPRIRAFASKFMRISIADERKAVTESIDRLHIVPPRVDGNLQFFSGGNQQKSLFAKWTLHRPDVIVLDEPTRGVDIGAKRSIYEAILSVASEGTAVILISSELEEVIYLSHRIALMADGRIIGEGPAADFTLDEVLRLLFDTGATEGAA